MKDFKYSSILNPMNSSIYFLLSCYYMVAVNGNKKLCQFVHMFPIFSTTNLF